MSIKRIATTAALVVVGLAFAGTANAAPGTETELQAQLTPLSLQSPTTAVVGRLHPCRNWRSGPLTTEQFRSEVQRYPACGRAWARLTGESDGVFRPEHYQVMGRLNVPAGSLVGNTGVDDAGNLSWYKYRLKPGDVVVVVKNTATAVAVATKQNCVNPLEVQQPPARVAQLPPMPRLVAWAKATATSTTYVRVNCPGAVVIVKASATAVAAAKAIGPGASARAKAKAKTAVAVICKQIKKVAKKKFGFLELRKVTDPPNKGGPFRICVRASKSLTLCYRIIGGQTLRVRNHGKDVLFPVEMRVRVCEDPVPRWVTPGCRTVTIKRGVNRVTIVNRLIPAPPAAKVCVTKRTFEDGIETTGRADRIINFVIEFRGVQYSLPNDTRVYCFAESFAAGTVLPVTETDAKGFTPDAAAISVTVGGPVGVFINRKVTPPPPPPPTPQCVSNCGPPPPKCDKCGEQVPPPPAPTQGPLAPPTPPSQSSAPPGGNTSQCQDPNNTAACQPPPP